MIVEGVNFVEDACRKMSKDRDESVRKQMLGDAYDMMNPPKKEGKRKKSASEEDNK